MSEWKTRRAALVAADAESAEWLRFEGDWVDAFVTRFVSLARGRLLNADGTLTSEAEIREAAKASALAAFDTSEDPEDMADGEWAEWKACRDA